MSDDGDRFSAFDAVDGDDGSEDSDSDPDSSEPEVSRTMPETQPEPTTDEPDNDDDEIEDPAFSYAESNQGPIYARPDTWDEYDDALELDVERHLRDRGVRNAQKRELHDAALRLAANNPEELAELLIEARQDS